MDTQIVILAAGKGTRMGNSELPKVLVPLKGKPVITYLLDEVAKLKDAPPPVIVVGYKSTMVKEELGKQYKYALQRDQLGTAHAVWSAASCITEKNVFTSNANITYNANTRTVTWNIGTLQGGKTVAADIQVSVRPSLSHVGTSPSITSGITLDAEELDSKARIKNTLNPLTTALSQRFRITVELFAGCLKCAMGNLPVKQLPQRTLRQ
jgi:hypothetical protein